MKSYKITTGQKNSITKPKKFNGNQFNALEDKNGVWFIWEVEAEFCRKYFGWTLEEAEYVPAKNMNILG